MYREKLATLNSFYELQYSASNMPVVKSDKYSWSLIELITFL